MSQKVKKGRNSHLDLPAIFDESLTTIIFFKSRTNWLLTVYFLKITFTNKNT